MNKLIKIGTNESTDTVYVELIHEMKINAKLVKKGLHIQFVDLHFPKLAVYFGNELTSFRLTGNKFHFIKTVIVSLRV